MWNGNYLAFNQFMAEAHDRYRFLEHELDKARIKEWLYKAMGLIGVYQVYPNKRSEITLIKDEDLGLSYAELPEGIIQINSVVNCNNTPLIYSSAIPTWNDGTTPPSYQLNGSIILTNICNVENPIIMTHDSFPVDDNEDPRVPDDVVYIEAMLAYIGYRMGYELWMMDRLVEVKYRELEREWLFYVNSAKTKMLMPSLDGMQSLANQLQRYNNAPGIHHASKFKYLNTP